MKDLTLLPPLKPPQHGGDLQRAKACYPQVKHWLDLSAALNPTPWPVPEIPSYCFQRLPEDYRTLIEAASAYYRQEHLWPLNGSQQGIESLPRLYLSLRLSAANHRDAEMGSRSGVGDHYRRATGADLGADIKVAVPEEGYQEHAWCWQKQGFQVLSYPTSAAVDLLACAEQCDLLVVINPNNPTGLCYPRELLRECHKKLQAKGGWLVVDEAFMDAYPEEQQAIYSVSDAACDSLIVLRSLGKFFGLAGIRSGFLLAGRAVIQALRQDTGPWPVSGVTAWLSEQMLRDYRWQCRMQRQLREWQTQQLLELQRVLPQGAQWAATPLFISVLLPTDGGLTPEKLQQRLAAAGIWVRVYNSRDDHHTGRLRLGLVSDKQVLADVSSAFHQAFVS